MLANDCLQRISYLLDLEDSAMAGVFAAAGKTVTGSQVGCWLKDDADPAYRVCSDVMLTSFLNGLINKKRGKKRGAEPAAEQTLNNNLIFKKLRIAFNLQAEEVVSIFSLADLEISQSELSAFFRRSDHKHYRECKDQVLEDFIKGMQIKYRGESQTEH
jgi:uncharacterized protein YehS (DUF1456 family)